MFYSRLSQERGSANFGWLDSKHSFSFGHYYDPKHMGFSVLRVINDDTVLGGAGFDTHGHRDMEIVSYVLEGAIEHKDSTGNQFIVPAGEVQRMSAGSGIRHSEYNHSDSEALRFLQIWILPNKKGGAPSYEQKHIVQSAVLTPLVTEHGENGSVSIQQDMAIHRLVLKAGEKHTFDVKKRPGYLHVINGELDIISDNESYRLKEGDALGLVEEKVLVKTDSSVTALWFDLPPVH